MLNKKINLIFFLPNFTKGGAAYSIYKLCKNLDKKIYEIHILCLKKCELKQELKKFTKSITEINTNRVFKTLFYLNKFTNKIYKKNKFKTIFISNIHYANVISALSIRKNNNVKIILTERTSLEQLKINYGILDAIKKTIILLLVKFTYKNADLVIANSKREAKNIKKICKCNTKFIYPPSYKKEIKFNKKRDTKKKNINILTVGSIVKEKGLDTIIKAIANIKEINIKLNIFGKEYDSRQNEKENLKYFIKKLNLNKNVKLHGFEDDLSNYYKNADLYINASHIEGFSSAIVDAINYSLPVICSDSFGGTREILLNGKGGDLFKINDHKSLSQKIKAFIKNPKKLIKKSLIAKRNIKKFNEINNLKKYEKIFKKI